jgi:HYR domain-containing protein
MPFLNSWRQRRTHNTTLITIVLILAFTLPLLVFADNIQNDITVGGSDTITAGGSTNVGYRVIGNSAPMGDSPGCNVTDGSPLSFTISVPAGVTASSSSLSFSSCGTFQTVTFSSSTPGNYAITLTNIIDADSADRYNNQANFILHVNAPPNTPPSLNLPGNILAEATSGAGASVSFSATANDAEDGNGLPASCTPASGSTFPIGSTTVNCSYTDTGGLPASGSFTVTVQDTTPPSLSLPGNITAEATGASGAAVSYSASANDLVDGAITPNCVPASGSTFGLGTTTVNCSATDAHGNSASGSFSVTVQDTTPPTLNLPGNITAEATGPSGAAVSYSASASDLVDGAITPNCVPASGSTFGLGTTTVNCSATDAHGNSASGSFSVTVQDTTPPTLNLPGNITVQATGPSGAAVSYSASANDLVDGAITPNCVPASGSTFALGTTTVNCSATDARSNSASGSFTVTVLYNFSGFFQPVDNLPVINAVKAGSAVPVKFSLGGNMGLNIFITGYPATGVVACGGSVDEVESTVTAGSSSLSYDPLTNQYIYVWKTNAAWAGTCRQLVIRFADGTQKMANFRFR